MRKISGWSTKALDEGTFIKVWLDQLNKASASIEKASHVTKSKHVIRDSTSNWGGATGDPRWSGRPAPSLDGVRNKALKLSVGCKQDIFIELFGACMSEEIFSAAWKQQKLILLSKAGKPLRSGHCGENFKAGNQQYAPGC